jgi:hypothetical protein
LIASLSQRGGLGGGEEQIKTQYDGRDSCGEPESAELVGARFSFFSLYLLLAYGH